VANLEEGEKDLGNAAIERLPWGRREGERISSFAYSLAMLSASDGHQGFAWAIRKGIISKHLFYDGFLIGGGDTAMASVFSNTFSHYPLLGGIIKKSMRSHFLNWAMGVHIDTQTSMGYAHGNILHLWHGDRKNRLYDLRHDVFESLDFDPENDLRVSSNGLYEWCSDKPDLHRGVREYFEIRNEEGKSSFFTSLLVERFHSSEERLKVIEERLNAIEMSIAYRIFRKSSKLYQAIVPFKIRLFVHGFLRENGWSGK
jgi:hypothetical protein